MNIQQIILNHLQEFSPSLLKSAEPFIIRSKSASIGKEFDTSTKNTLITTSRVSEKYLPDVDSSNCILYLGKTEKDFSSSSACVIQLPNDINRQKLDGLLVHLIDDIMLIYQAKNSFYNAYTKNYSLKELVDHVEEYLHCPVSIFNLTSDPIAMGKHFQNSMKNDAIIKEYQKNGFISVSFAQKNEFKTFLKKLSEACRPFTYHHKDPDINDRRVYPVISGKTKMAHCTVILNHTLSDVEDEILQYLCDLVLFELQRNPVNIFSNSMDSTILKGLLSGKYKTAEDLSKNVDFSQFADIQRLYLFSISLNETFAATDPGFLLRELLALISPLIKWSKILYESNRLFVLVNTSRFHFIFDRESELDSFFKRTGFLCAVSQPYSDLKETHTQYIQTEYLLKVSRFLKKNTGLAIGYSLFFPKIAFTLNEHGLENYCLAQLLYLQKNFKNASVLLETVVTYIEEGFSIARTAEKLSIHRNTVQRRLEKFQELTTLSLSSGRDICQIYTSLEFMKFKQLTSDSGLLSAD